MVARKRKIDIEGFYKKYPTIEEDELTIIKYAKSTIIIGYPFSPLEEYSKCSNESICEKIEEFLDN